MTGGGSCECKKGLGARTRVPRSRRFFSGF